MTAYAIRFFLTRRLQFQTLLKSSQSGLNSSQYLRLMALSGSDIFLGFPLSLYYLLYYVIRNAKDLLPFDWSDVHYGWSYVGRVPFTDFPRYYYAAENFISTDLSRWLAVVLAIVFFLFFGIAEDATAEYLKWIDRVKRLLRLDRAKPDIGYV